MKSDIQISFQELRNITQRIILLISEETGYNKKKISLQTSINNQIGVAGNDWDDILKALYQRENLILEGLNFYDYFLDETQIGLPFPINIPFIPLHIIPYVLSQGWKRIGWREFFFGVNKRPDLTIADLVTSKIEGRFVKRKDRVFKITGSQ